MTPQRTAALSGRSSSRVASVIAALAMACGDGGGGGGGGSPAAPPPPVADAAPPETADAAPAPVCPVPPALVPALGGAAFKYPVEMIEGPGRRFYIVEQGGKVQVVPRDGGAITTAIDISAKIVYGGEAGLLGIAFDPKFSESGFVYLYFTAKLTPPTPNHVFQDIVARFTSHDGGATIDPASQKVLIKVEDPYANHNGGKLAFGPDGMLYVGIGDGGSAGDPLKNGQNKRVLFGKILRIDPHAGATYGIPPDNPFGNEVWAYGLRNPWKFSFDRATGQLWCGDVGQSGYEEVDIIERGGNYGWNVREGKHCYAATTCASAGMTDPIVEYTHAEGIAITGGYVYRGTKLPSLVGRFVFGDYGSGKIWSAAATDTAPVPLIESGVGISSFGQDSDGEIYVVDFIRGKIQQLVGGPAPPCP